MTKTKTCQNCKAEFIIEPEDFEFYKKIDVPEPTFCPICRAQRRLYFRSGMLLYKRKIEGYNKEVFSSIPPDSPFKVYHFEDWYSDKRDTMKYGKDYDFSRPFFEQLKDLLINTGVPNTYSSNAVNSPYTANSVDIKNCYLVFNTGFSENCAYGIDVNNSRDSYDLVTVNSCELCYDLFGCGECYQVFFSAECRDCSNVWFSKNLVNCHNCFGCVNLRHKKHYIFNKPYSKEEYKKKLKEFNLGSYKNILSLWQEAKEFHLKFPKKYMIGNKNINVVGNYLRNCKNAKNCFISRDLEDCAYCQMILFFYGRDCYDISIAGGELCYEVGEGGGYRLKSCWYMMPKNLKTRDAGLYDIEYSIGIFNSHDLFGCIALRHKKYCILNKQYSKEEYEKMVSKIKEHMHTMPYIDKKGRVYKYGEFFPIDFSPFAYNETMAQEYFPLSKEQVLSQGFRWHDRPKPEHKPTIKAKDLPDNIKDVDESILKKVIECQAGTVPEASGTVHDSCHGSGVFRIISQEFKFLKKQNLPLPRLCPDCRHQERIKQRNPLKLWPRKCQCAGKKSSNQVYQNTIEHSHKNKPCSNTFQTTYAPDRKEIVYCEKCYLKEVG